MRLVIEICDEDVQKILTTLIPKDMKKTLKRAHLTEIVREAAIELHEGGKPIFTAAEIYHTAIETHEGVNLQSLKLRVIGCTPDHPSFKHQLTRSDFLTYIARGKYSLVESVTATLAPTQLTDEDPHTVEELAERMRELHTRAVGDPSTEDPTE